MLPWLRLPVLLRRCGSLIKQNLMQIFYNWLVPFHAHPIFHLVLSKKRKKCKKPSFIIPTLTFESGMQSVHCDSNKSDKVKILGTKKGNHKDRKSLLKMNLRQTKVLWLSINNQWWKTNYVHFQYPKTFFSFRETAIWSLPGVQLKFYIVNFIVC